jgi:hypothetical protein
MFRFGPIATVLAEDPAYQVEHLFQQLVKRRSHQLRALNEEIPA